MALYERPVFRKSVFQLMNSLIPFAVLWYFAYLTLSISVWLTLGLDVCAASFLVRIFIIFHDCCHNAFFSSRKANAIVGTITGILTCCPYNQWRYSHAVHHATSSNLSQRKMGEIWILTVNEYLALPRSKQLFYRFYRHPLVMFGLGPIYTFLIAYRFNRKKARKKERLNTYLTNLGIVGVVALLCWAVGWSSFLLVQGPIFYLSGMVGIWLFYVQHQFEDTYFEREEKWSYISAAMEGSSFYNLPKFLHWVTGNIGFHHIHHLSPRIPNYHLQKLHREYPFLQDVPTIGLRSSFRSLRFRVWCEEEKRFLSFRELKTARIKK